MHVYITGIDPEDNQLVVLQPNGVWLYPSSIGSTTPVRIINDIAIAVGGKVSTTKTALPGYISSGRLWVANGILKFYTINGASLVQPSANRISE